MNSFNEIEHHYGKNIHVLNNYFLSTVLARLCSPETIQPAINQLIHLLYSSLITHLVCEEFEVCTQNIPTRMTTKHPSIKLKGTWTNENLKSICVNLARAGTFPSHICYETLHYILKPHHIRQDHIFAARVLNENNQVIGSNLGDAKIGGSIDDSYVLFPDPMGATGNTIVSTIDFYKNANLGKARKYIALHLIVTPEYLKNMADHHPDAIIYAVRLDRGLSPPNILNTTPGTNWDKEKGLDENQYIVPGGGGFGELMNNSFT